MNIVNVGYDSTNFYVVETEKGKLLIDSGWPGTFPKLLAELKRKGIILNEIKYLLVTHFHPDHAGLTQELKNHGAKLVLMENQINFIEPLTVFFKTKKFPYVEIKQKDNILLKFEESRTFLDDLGIRGEIIPTPGHSQDSITLRLDEGFAFTGDLHTPDLVPEDQVEIVKKSWDRIREQKIVRIFPGHGN